MFVKWLINTTYGLVFKQFQGFSKKTLWLNGFLLGNVNYKKQHPELHLLKKYLRNLKSASSLLKACCSMWFLQETYV